MKSEGYLHFWNNLTYRRLRFDSKADLIEKVIPLENNHYLFLDRAKNYHLVNHNPSPKIAVRYPVPSYADCLNPNTLYSVDYLHLYRHIYGRKISRKCMEDYYYHIDKKISKYIQFVYLGNHKLAIQMNRYDPLAIIDLHNPNYFPEIFADIYETKLLIKASNGCIAWYDRKTVSVWLFCYSLYKRKQLNFTALKIKGLYRLNDEIIIAKSKSNIELLNMVKNTIIRSFNFLNPEPLHLSVHSSSNTFSYLSDGYIYVYTLEKGKIKSENFYDFTEFQETCGGYTFIGDSYIAAEIEENIYLFLLDTHAFSLITVLQNLWPSHLDSHGLNLYCCNYAVKKGSIMQIYSLDSNRFIVVGSFCKRQYLLHGLQRVGIYTCDFQEISEKRPCVLSASTLNSLDGLSRFNYNISSTLLFEEYRDPVTAVDTLGDQTAAFITERGRLFKVNLKLNKVYLVTEITGVMAPKGVETNEPKHIDKFSLLSYDIILLSIKTGASPYVRIVLFSMSTKSIKWDSNNLRNNDLDDQEEYSFYDAIKIDGNTVLTSYNVRINQITVYQVGELVINNEHKKPYVFRQILTTDKNDQPIYEKLWLMHGSIVGMRNVRNVFHLSIFDQGSHQILGELHLDKYFALADLHIWGIIDVKSLTKEVISIHIKMTTDDYIILIYNWKNQQILRQLKTDNSLISTFKETYFIQDRKANLENVVMFGFYALVENGIKIKSIKEIMNGSPTDDFEVEEPDLGMCIWPSNFSAMPNKMLSVAYESDHNKNYICLIRPARFKLECLRVLKSNLKNYYHDYVFTDILDMIFL